MSEPFYEVASIDYPIIDSDAHVNEPPELWQERVPQRLKTRAPKVMHTPEGDVWSFDDAKKLRPLGLTPTAGLSYSVPCIRMRYAGDRPGSFDRQRASATLTPTAVCSDPLSSVTLAGLDLLRRSPQCACARLQRVAAGIRAVRRVSCRVPSSPPMGSTTRSPSSSGR